MDRKLIFLDIDGTILVHKEGIRQTVRDGLCRARKRGHRILICTGRSMCTLPEDLHDMELDGIIASAGSDIWIHGKNVFRQSLNVELVLKACRILEEINAIYVLEGFGGVYVSERGRRILTEEGLVPGSNPEILRWKQFFSRQEHVRYIRDWKPEQAPIPKIAFLFEHPENVEKLYREVGEELYPVLFQGNAGNFVNGEMMAKTVNKGTAILYTAEFFGTDIGNTIAFGDSMNDYQMIKQAGCGVVMGNGEEGLKEIADRVCEPVNEDGVIRELERMGVIV